MLISAGSLTAQPDGHEPLPKAKRAFDNAIKYWNELSFDKAEKELQKAIRIDSVYIDPYILLADIAFDRSRYDEAIGYYNQAIAIDSSFSPTLYYLLGKVYFEKEDYASAANSFGYFLRYRVSEKIKGVLPWTFIKKPNSGGMPLRTRYHSSLKTWGNMLIQSMMSM